MKTHSKNESPVKSWAMPLAILILTGSAAVWAANKPTTDERLEELKKTVEQVNGHVLDVRSDAKAAKIALSEIAKGMKDVKSSASLNFSALTAKIQVAQNAIDRMQSTAAAIENGVAQALSSVADVKSAVLAVQTDVRSVGSDVKEVGSDVKAVGSDVKTVGSNVEDLQRNLAIANKSLEQLRATVGEYETKRVIASIEQQLRTGKYTIELYHTASQGGALDLIQQIVSKRMQECADAGANVEFAVRAYYSRAITALSAGHSSRAVANFGRAYRELVRASKGPWAIFPMF